LTLSKKSKTNSVNCNKALATIDHNKTKSSDAGISDSNLLSLIMAQLGVHPVIGIFSSLATKDYVQMKCIFIKIFNVANDAIKLSIN
jgi:hypothetical protein